MSNNTKAISFWNFLQENTIEIPIIQRDYAQGRLGKENLRKNFLADLKNALDRDETMKLDFVYGSTENEKLNPLDGQQRLTTLWLLHWYIALRARKLNEDTCIIFRNFTYETRISSREFCENLCNPEYFKNFNGNDIVGFITKQTWFYSAWKQDPTIQSMLRMLGGTKITDKNKEDIVDGIEELFACPSQCEIEGNGRCILMRNFESYWEKLVSNAPIVFYYLPLKDFGLSDDLYIKMNARGKQLTSFENFKADLIGYITKQAEDNPESEWKNLLDAENGIAIKLDTDWTDIFWKNRSIGIIDKESKKRKSDQIDEIYFAFLNRFFWNELFIAKKMDNINEYVLDIGKEDESSTQENNNSSYKYLNNSEHSNDTTIAYEGLDVYRYDNGTIPISFFQKIKRVLDNYFAYSKDDNCLPECPWEKSFKFIPQYDEDNSNNNIEIENNAKEKILKVTTLNQIQRIVFFAVCKYFDHDDKVSDSETSLKRWMRAVWNLVSGEDQNGRSEIRSTSAMRSAIKFIDSLDSHKVYESLKSYDVNTLSATSFDERCKEEIAKAKQILGEDGKLRLYVGIHQKEDDSNYQTWEELIIDAEKHAFFKGAIRFLFINGNEKPFWDDFDTKWDNAKAYIPNQKEESRQTIQLMIPYIKDSDLKNIFSDRYLSNDDNNLKLLLLRFLRYVHDFLMNQNKEQELSLYQKDLLFLSTECPNFWIHKEWEEGMDVVSGYSKKAGYYQWESYIIGNNFFIERIELLKNISSICIVDENRIKESKDYKIWKGLFIEFKYKGYLFRWQASDWVDMYDENGSNLWEKELHSHYKGSEKESFTDGKTLEKELERCCKGYDGFQD